MDSEREEFAFVTLQNNQWITTDLPPKHSDIEFPWRVYQDCLYFKGRLLGPIVRQDVTGKLFLRNLTRFVFEKGLDALTDGDKEVIEEIWST